ncbi:MAG TPA: endonuclease NucS [Alphaproteobacteria bacterium]|nr:endonuclease NucS [Alphaproteobacteria bacterium]
MDKKVINDVNIINTALERNETVIIGASCEVSYYGKVESYLHTGDRIIIVKNDKTILVHQPSGVNPINYMKEGTEVKITVENDKIILKAKHLFLKDFLDAKIHKIQFYNSHKLEDGADIEVVGSEKDMSDMIYDNPLIIEKGFKPFSREEHTKFGFIDVFGTDKNGKVVVIECKRDNADFKAVSQLHRYIQKIAKSKGIKEDAIRGIIAAPKISSNAKTMLEEHGYSFVSVSPPKYLERYDKKQKKLFDY